MESGANVAPLTSGVKYPPPLTKSARRVLVIVATPGLPQGGSGDREPPKRRPWRGTPLDVHRRRISDEEADVRGEARGVRASAGRGGHELHPSRPCGRGLQAHRQGMAQRAHPRHRGGETKRQAWTGIVPPWTNPNGSTRATSIRRSASRSPTGCARAIRSAPPPGCRDATPARSAARSSATGIPGPATASPAAPGRRRPAGSNAPNRARRPTARRCGRGYRPGCAGIGARSR